MLGCLPNHFCLLRKRMVFVQVLKANTGHRLPTTVDENGKFSYVSADMRPVPPGEHLQSKKQHFYLNSASLRFETVDRG
jgi:hypothetical protein